MKLETGSNASIITFKGNTAKIHPSVFLCDGVKIIGEVTIGKDSSVWYNSVIRGDINYIRIGERTNIQDLSVLHVTEGDYPVVVGDDVLIGHSVIIHGATVNNNCMIGIGSRLLDGSFVNSYSLVAAGSVVLEKFIVPEGTLVAGVPAKIIRDLTPKEIDRVGKISENYLGYVNEYRRELKKNTNS